MAHRPLDETTVGDEKLTDGHMEKHDLEGQHAASSVHDYDVERVERVYR